MFLPLTSFRRNWFSPLGGTQGTKRQSIAKKRNMKKQAIYALRTFGAAALVLTFVLMPIPIDTAQAQQSVTEEEAHAIGVDAYLYFYPLVTMDMTRKQLTNIEPGKEFGGPMNTFANVPEYPASRYEGRCSAELRHALFHLDGSISPRSR